MKLTKSEIAHSHLNTPNAHKIFQPFPNLRNIKCESWFTPLNSRITLYTYFLVIEKLRSNITPSA